MKEEITVSQLKEKLEAAQDEIAIILNRLQSETAIIITGLSIHFNHVETARTDDLKLKIEFDLSQDT